MCQFKIESASLFSLCLNYFFALNCYSFNEGTTNHNFVENPNTGFYITKQNKYIYLLIFKECENGVFQNCLVRYTEFVENGLNLLPGPNQGR